MKPISCHVFTPDLLTDPKYFWNCKTPEQLKSYYINLQSRTDDDRAALLAIIQNEKKLCTYIRTTTLTLDGWCSEEKACVLAALVMALKPAVCVEIGVFGGRSLFPMALVAKQLELSTKVIGIDPYSAKASVENELGENAKWWGDLDHEAILQKFQDNSKRMGLTDRIALIRKRSDDVTPELCQILHIDGNHSDQAVKDAMRFGPSVQVGGVVVCDDIMWGGGAVLRAIDCLEDMGFVEAFRVTANGECWNVMQRVK